MFLTSTDSERVDPAHRPTVRIVRRRTVPRTAVISLALAAAAVMVLFFVWRLWRRDEVSEMRRRGLTDVEVTWKCDGGHTFRAEAHDGARSCWTCNRPANPVANYSCPDHGTYEAAVQFSTDGKGVSRVAKVRMQDASWKEPAEGLRCPKCGSDLVRAKADPLDSLARKRKTGS